MEIAKHSYLRVFLTLRFDDRLQTSLRSAADDKVSVNTRWRQLIDIMSQNPKNFAPELVKNGLLEIRQLIDRTEIADRVIGVKSLSGRIKSAPLVQLLAADQVPVASAVISGAKLTDQEWADIIPALPIRARGFLRNRSDIGPKTRKALMIWSAADFILPSEAAEIREEEGNSNQFEVMVLDDRPEAQLPGNNDNARQSLTDGVPNNQRIGEIVERIERLRKNRESGDEPAADIAHAPPTPINDTYISEICFETDEYGTICQAQGAPRGAIVGIAISEPAFGDSPGPDAYGAAAFRQRMPMENARMRLYGAENITGDWRITADPFFDIRNGRFQGYHGFLRRPNLAESPQIRQAAKGEDNLQQLVHELRTPLGAIIGFSEIIEGQLFGPVSAEYRRLARDIHGDAERLLSGFDDLSVAAKIESGGLTANAGITECGWIAERLAERLRGLSKSLSVTLNLIKADPVRSFAVESEMAERLFSRLLSAVIIGCDADEVLSGRFYTEPGYPAVNKFSLTLPQRLIGLTEDQLLGTIPDEQDDTDGTSLLGLGFSLRLVRNLARNVAGDLRFHKEYLLLILPAVDDSAGQIRSDQ